MRTRTVSSHRPAPPSLKIQVFVYGKVSNPMNGSHRHWSMRAKWADVWRERTRVSWMVCGQPTWSGPACVTFTAHVARFFDDDNLPPCLKPVRDEAVLRILGTDDGPTCGHTFVYQQEVRPPSERGVLITITPKSLDDVREHGL